MHWAASVQGLPIAAPSPRVCIGPKGAEAVGAEVLDWYGLPAMTPEIAGQGAKQDEVDAEETLKYLLSSEESLADRGMVSTGRYAPYLDM